MARRTFVVIAGVEIFTHWVVEVELRKLELTDGRHRCLRAASAEGSRQGPLAVGPRRTVAPV